MNVAAGAVIAANAAANAAVHAAAVTTRKAGAPEVANEALSAASKPATKSVRKIARAASRVKAASPVNHAYRAWTCPPLTVRRRLSAKSAPRAASAAITAEARVQSVMYHRAPKAPARPIPACRPSSTPQPVPKRRLPMANATAVAVAGVAVVTAAIAGVTKLACWAKRAPKLKAPSPGWMVRTPAKRPWPRQRRLLKAAKDQPKAASANADAVGAVAAVSATAKAVKSARRAQPKALKAAVKVKPQPLHRWPWPPLTLA